MIWINQNRNTAKQSDLKINSKGKKTYFIRNDYSKRPTVKQSCKYKHSNYFTIKDENTRLVERTTIKGRRTTNGGKGPSAMFRKIYFLAKVGVVVRITFVSN